MCRTYRHLKPGGLVHRFHRCTVHRALRGWTAIEPGRGVRGGGGERVRRIHSIYTSTMGEPRCDGPLCGFLWQISRAHTRGNTDGHGGGGRRVQAWRTRVRACVLTCARASERARVHTAALNVKPPLTSRRWIARALCACTVLELSIEPSNAVL